MNVSAKDYKEVRMLETVNTNQVSSLRSTLYDMASSAGKPYGKHESSVAGINNKSNIQQESKKIHKEQLEQELNLDKLNKQMKQIGTDINFRYNDDIEGLVVTVKEAGGEKIIREIPTKEVIALVRQMNEVVGLIFDAKC